MLSAEAALNIGSCKHPIERSDEDAAIQALQTGLRNICEEDALAVKMHGAQHLLRLALTGYFRRHTATLRASSDIASIKAKTQAWAKHGFPAESRKWCGSSPCFPPSLFSLLPSLSSHSVLQCGKLHTLTALQLSGQIRCRMQTVLQSDA